VLARNSYAQEYVNHARAQFDTELSAFETVRSAASARERTALEAFEPLMVRHLVLALDGYFTHRTRGLEKKDGNPLTEVRWICDAIMNHDNVLPAPPVPALKPQTSVTGLAEGDTVGLDVATFRTLAEAFFAEIESRYPESA
jgi:hypothetical protein